MVMSVEVLLSLIFFALMLGNCHLRTITNALNKRNDDERPE